MVEKNCLIIDDEAAAQSRIFKTDVADKLHQKGIKANLILIDAADKDIQTDERIDIDKLKQHIETQLNGKKLDIVACDYELSCDTVNGIDVIGLVRSLRRKAPIFLYSGKFERVITDLLKVYKPEEPHSAQKVAKSIQKIYSSKIEEFIERSDYPQRLVNLLQKEADDIDDVFNKKIREYPNLEFKSCYPKFEGKKLLEIADEIDKSTIQSQRFLEELVEQTIAYLIKSNEDE